MALLSFQKPVHAACLKHIRTKASIEFEGMKIHPPLVVNASVSSGKSVMIGELAKEVYDLGEVKAEHFRSQGFSSVKNKVKVLIIQRQGILCEQNHEAGWALDLKSSVYSASAFGGRKSLYYDVVYATEGTIARALENRFGHDKSWHPDLVLIDECHQVGWDDSESQFMKTILHFYRLKPHLRLVGFTGSPFRSLDSIIGPFWSGFASIEPGDPFYPEGGVGNGLVSTEFLADEGWVVRPRFGSHAAPGYDFSLADWDKDDEKELNKLTESEQLMAEILAEVITIATPRKGVLIFASTKKHARNIVKMLERLGIEPSTVGLVIDSTPEKEKTRILKAAQVGAIKYTVNVGVLTTGINCAWWDTLVFMRPIGTLTLLTQAIGRVLRLLIGPDEVPMIDRDPLTADERKDLIAASDKPDALVLDYAGVMDRLGKLYENPVLEQAELERAKKEHETIQCPKCEAENSMHARRCIQVDKNTKLRCDHFWSFRLCPHCQTQNDVVARQCRNAECAAELIDPNEKLNKKHYRDSEEIPVVSMLLESGKAGALYVKWKLSDGREPIEIYYPNAGAKAALNTAIWYNQCVKDLPVPAKSKAVLRRMSATQISKMASLVPVPEYVAARQMDSGKWVIGRRIYAEAVE